MDGLGDAERDSEVIERILDGDSSSFEILVARYNPLVFGIVVKHVPSDRVEDVAQDAFIEAYRSLRSFSRKSPFSHWISKIAVRCCYDFWRQHRSTREMAISSLSEAGEQWIDNVLATRSREAFERESSAREAAEVLQYALGKLSAEDRMVVTLVHLDGRPVREAASLLGWSMVSVKVRAHRSRQKLRKIISDLLGE